MTINPALIAPGGLYCGVCAIYIAHRDNNHKFKQRLLNLYKWVQDEEDRDSCPDCGHKVFRGVVKCNQCKVQQELD
jgi:rRNA maturation endonuclease Nob1